MHRTPFQPLLAGKTYRDSMKDYPAPATHNIVLISKTQPMEMAVRSLTASHWDGNNVAFIGHVVSEWGVFDANTLAERLSALAVKHNVAMSEITVKAL